MELPSEESLRWLVSRYAALLAAHGEGIGKPHLVQPTPDDFPDAFESSATGVARFLERMIEYSPVSSNVDVMIRFTDDEESSGCGTGGCGTGACGTKGDGVSDVVTDAGEAYVLSLPMRDVGSDVRLSTTFARSIGSLVLFEAGEQVDPGERGPMSELAAAACGFGVLLLAGSHIVGKSCGGFSVDRHTHLAPEELAVLLALFTRLHGGKPREARVHLDATQAEAFDEALVWVDSNSSLVVELDARPELLADGVFEICETKGLFGRLLSGSKNADRVDLAPVSRRPSRSAEEQKKLDEARALVDAALADVGPRAG